MDVSTPNFSEQTWSISEGQTAIADNNREQSLQNLHQNSQDNRDLNGNINNDAVSKPIQDNLEVLQKESDSVEVGEKMFRKSSESEDLFLTSTNETFEQSIESSPYNTENISEQITSERDNLLGDKEEDKEILSKVETTSQDLQQEKSLTLVLDEQSSIDFQNSKITDVATKEPSLSNLTPEQPAKSPVVTKEPSLSSLTPEQPAKSPVATKELSLSDLTSEQPAKSPVATEEPSSPDLTPEQPAKSPVATKKPSLSEQPATSPVATKEPSSLELTPEEPTKSPLVTKETSLSSLVPEQPANKFEATFSELNQDFLGYKSKLASLDTG